MKTNHFYFIITLQNTLRTHLSLENDLNCYSYVHFTFALVPGLFLLRTAVPSAMTISTDLEFD